MSVATSPSRTSNPVPALPHRRRHLLLAAAAALAMVTLPVSGASAHDALVSADPADGARVDVVPAEITLVFTSPPLGVGAEVQVTGPDGAVVPVDGLQVVDTTVIQPMPADLPAGAYGVAWRVTSADGHPISGEHTFTAVTGAAPAAGGTPEPAPAVSPSTDATTDPASEPPSAPGEAASRADDTPSGARWISLGLGAVLVLGAAVLVVRRLGSTR